MDLNEDGYGVVCGAEVDHVEATLLRTLSARALGQSAFFRTHCSDRRNGSHIPQHRKQSARKKTTCGDSRSRTHQVADLRLLAQQVSTRRRRLNVPTLWLAIKGDGLRRAPCGWGCGCGVNLGRTLQTHRLTGGWHFSPSLFRPLLTRMVVRALALSVTFRPLPTRMALRIESGHNGPPDQKNDPSCSKIAAAEALYNPFTQRIRSVQRPKVDSKNSDKRGTGTAHAPDEAGDDSPHPTTFKAKAADGKRAPRSSACQ